MERIAPKYAWPKRAVLISRHNFSKCSGSAISCTMPLVATEFCGVALEFKEIIQITYNTLSKNTKS